MELNETKALPGFEPEIGRWLWALEEVRRRTIHVVGGLDGRTLDWEGPDGGENAIGTLLYHIALVEVSWLFLDVLSCEIPGDVKADFPFPMGIERRLTPVRGVSLAHHLGRLERARARLLDEHRSMTLAEWRRLRPAVDNADSQVTPEWAIFHLIEHEAGHAFQISALKRRAEAALAAGPAA